MFLFRSRVCITYIRHKIYFLFEDKLNSFKKFKKYMYIYFFFNIVKINTKVCSKRKFLNKF